MANSMAASRDGAHRLFGFCAFAGALALATFSFTASAQNTTTLATNAGYAVADPSGEARAQGFTTGSHPYGYDLESVVLSLRLVPPSVPAHALVVLHADDAGMPGDVVARFTNPESLTVGSNRFRAPFGTWLEPDSTYYLAVNLEENVGTVFGLGTTAGIRDPSASDWTIDDSSWTYRDARGWGIDVASVLRFALTGRPHTLALTPLVQTEPAPTAAPAVEAEAVADASSAAVVAAEDVEPAPAEESVSVAAVLGATDAPAENVEPTAMAVTAVTADLAEAADMAEMAATAETAATVETAATAETVATAETAEADDSEPGLTLEVYTGPEPSLLLVANTGQPPAALSSSILGQGFTTGRDTRGYTLGGVDLYMENATADALSRALLTLHADADGEPGQLLARFANPDSVTPGANRFRAPEGAVLDPNTTYFLVVNMVADARQAFALITTGKADVPMGNREWLAHTGSWSLTDNWLWEANADHALRFALFKPREDAPALPTSGPAVVAAVPVPDAPGDREKPVSEAVSKPPGEPEEVVAAAISEWATESGEVVDAP